MLKNSRMRGQAKHLINGLIDDEDGTITLQTDRLHQLKEKFLKEFARARFQETCATDGAQMIKAMHEFGFADVVLEDLIVHDAYAIEIALMANARAIWELTMEVCTPIRAQRRLSSISTYAPSEIFRQPFYDRLDQISSWANHAVPGSNRLPLDLAAQSRGSVFNSFVPSQKLAKQLFNNFYRLY